MSATETSAKPSTEPSTEASTKITGETAKTIQQPSINKPGETIKDEISFGVWMDRSSASVLSSRDILAELARPNGDVVIEPFHPQQLSTEPYQYNQ
jgi:hypothetical protein